MKNRSLWALVGHLFLLHTLSVHAADLSLQFQHLWNDEPVRIGKPLKHPDGSTITFSRISYLLSNPVLLTANGNKLSRKDWFGFVEVSEADLMIHLSGLKPIDNNNPDGDIKIKFTGLRPGEKLYEELLISGSEIKTSNEKIFKSIEEFLSKDKLDQALKDLNDCIVMNDVKNIREILIKNVEGYKEQKNSKEII